MTEPERISIDEARRIALTAQGFDRARPTKPKRTHLRRVFDDIGIVQLDTVNVFLRAHEMTLFSRLGPHPRSWLRDGVTDGELFEYWAHGMCYTPTGLHHLHRWRMEHFADTADHRSIAVRKPEVVANMLAQVRRRGPLNISDVQGRVRKRKSEWWDWDDAKQALEYLVLAGQVTVTRRPDFGKMYDLPERVLPAEALDVQTPPVATARRQLTLQAVKSLGVASANEIAMYHHQRTATVRGFLAELVEAGDVIPVRVEGWSKPGFVHPSVAERAPTSFSTRTLVNAFDPMMWSRERIARLFQFDYVFEIFVPKAKRVWGYYVYPFLYDGHFAARVDLKADRQARVLRVQSAWIEPDLDNGEDRPEIADGLIAELTDLAAWLELDAVGAVDRGNLAGSLHSAGAKPLD